MRLIPISAKNFAPILQILLFTNFCQCYDFTAGNYRSETEYLANQIKKIRDETTEVQEYVKIEFFPKLFNKLKEYYDLFNIF